MITIELFSLNAIFIISILLVIIIGILFGEFFYRKKNASIFLLLLIGFVMTIGIILRYISLVGIIDINKFIFASIGLILIIISLFLFIKFYNKSAPFLLVILSAIMVLDIMDIHSNSLLFTITYYSLLLFFTLTYYIFTIIFLIKLSNGTKRKKPNKRKINMKKILLIFVCILIAFFAFFIIERLLPSEQSQGYTKELRIATRVGYWDVGEKLLDDFEKEYGVNIILEVYDEQYDAFKDLVAGNSNQDLVVLIDAFVEEGIRLDLFKKIDKSKIPNLKKYDISKFSYDSNNIYSTPYITGSMGLIINTKYIPEDTNSWEVLWNQEYRGRIATFNNPDELFSMALLNIGYDMNSNDASEVRESYNYLKYQENFDIKRLNHVDIYEMMQSEELWAAQEYSGSASRLMAGNNFFKYIIPKEGSMRGTDNFVIPKNAKNKETAELFMDFMLRLDIGVRVIEYSMLPLGNNDANKLSPTDILIHTEEEISRMENINLSKSKDVNELKRNLWKVLEQ